MNIDKVISILRNQEKLKALAGQELARFLSINTMDIFYRYIKNTIPLQGVTNTGVKFVFHGLECYVRADNWEVELEFGPNGEIKGFDRYTICHMLGYKIDLCDDVIKILENSKVLTLIDPDLFSLLLNPLLKATMDSMSEEQKIDLNVADRYMLSCATLN